MVGAALVQLVYLAQNQSLLLATLYAEVLEQPAHQHAVINPYLDRAHLKFLKDLVNDCYQFGIEAWRHRILADHIDIALVTLTEASTLGAFAAINALHLIATEREVELVFVLGDIARQRYREVETQGQFGIAAFEQAAGGLGKVNLTFGFAARLGQQHFAQFNRRRFYRQETVAFESRANVVQHLLKGDLIQWQ